MAGPSKVQFPGQGKKQRMRARGTKRASEGVLKRLEKNLENLLDDPHAFMPTVAYSVIALTVLTAVTGAWMVFAATPL